MVELKVFLIFLTVTCLAQVEGANVKRSWFNKKTTASTTTTSTTTEVVPETATAEPVETAVPLIVSTLASVVPKLKVTTQVPTPTTTEKSGVLNFLRTGLKDIPILNVLQDTLVKTVDNVIDLPGNLVEDIQSGNPLNIVKTALKVLPLVNETLVDTAFDVVEDQLVNLPNTVVEGVKEGAHLVNDTAYITGDVLSSLLNPLTSVVSTGLDKGVDLVDATGNLLGNVVDPVTKMGVSLVNSTLQGTGKLVDTITDTVGDTVSGTVGLVGGLVNTLGLPLVIIIAIVIIVIIITLICCCVCCICKCVKGKKKNSYAPYTPGKNSDTEDAQKLLKRSEIHE